MTPSASATPTDPRDRLSDCRLAPLRFAGGAYIVSCLWVFFYDPHAPQQLLSTISLLLQNAVLVGVYILVDVHLRRPALRFILAGLLCVFAATTVADMLLLQLTSTPLAHVVPIIWSTGSPLVALHEWVDLTLAQAVSIAGALVLSFIGGGLAHRVMPRCAMTGAHRRRFHIILIALATAWLGEHAVARHTSAYVSRTATMPMYVRLFPAAPGNAYTIRLAPPPTEAERRAALERIEPLDDPPHVLFVLLESFRGDLVDPEITPNLYRLAREGIDYPRAVTEAILTSLSWNVILMDRPSFLFHYDLRRAEHEDLAAWPLEVLHRAGYRVWISASTDMAANLYTRRLLGTEGTVERFHMAYDPAEPLRHIWDEQATDTLIEWIEEMDASIPHYMLLQLDATHWDYYFHDENAIVEPYSEIVRPMRLQSQDELDLVYNRYLNAAHDNDLNLGRVLDALASRGLGDDTAVIVVSDHGEGFRVGQVGHSVLHRHTRRIPIIMKLPGVEATESDAIISPRAIYPTLYDHLGLEGLPGRFTLGTSALPPKKGEHAAITFHGTGKSADLKLDEVIIRLDVRFDDENVTFTPVGVFDHEDQPLGNMKMHLETQPWREALDRLMPTVVAP